MLGQLIVTPEEVASKISTMKEDRSPGEDGISPKILTETVEQMIIPLAHVLTCHCRKETFHYNVNKPISFLY